MITGKTLIDWGFKPSKHFADLIAVANALRFSGYTDEAVQTRLITAIAENVPTTTPLQHPPATYSVCLDAETPDEVTNKAKVIEHMEALLRVPTVVAGAVMPDACPSGQPLGTVPVGGVVATSNAIHPGMHSADICCSMAITIFADDYDAKALLDTVQASTHFGPGGRKDPIALPKGLPDSIMANHFLQDLMHKATRDFASQGDGNHFAYVGRIASTGQLALVTHHGSRGFGAALYKKGMLEAKRHTTKHSPETPAHNAWIPADSLLGQQYWSALQIVREWTKRSHYAIHDLVAGRLGLRVHGRFWNEHNFVFQKADGLFYHGKGATPSWHSYAEDACGLTLIPLNMAEPILVAAPRNNPIALGFAPHGAGRNLSRTAYLKTNEPAWPADIDARFHCGIPDLAELPGAYKNAATVRAQIDKFGLAHVVDTVIPYGSIMSGDWERDAPWRKARAAKATEPQADSTE